MSSALLAYVTGAWGRDKQEGQAGFASPANGNLHPCFWSGWKFSWKSIVQEKRRRMLEMCELETRLRLMFKVRCLFFTLRDMGGASMPMPA